MITTAIIISYQDKTPILVPYRHPDTIQVKISPTMTRSDLELITPSQDEFYDAKIFTTSFHSSDRSNLENLKRNGYFYSYSLSAKRPVNELGIIINIAISLNPDDPGLASILDPTSRSTNTAKRISFTGKPIGEFAWSHPLSLIVADQWILMKIQFMPKLIKNPNGSYSIPTISDADKAWAEEMGRKILDRATVLGLTSRPAESAPLWAKEQVAKRRAARK